MAQDANEAVRQTAQESKEAVRQTAQETVDTAKEAAQDISQQVQQQAGDVIEKASGQLADTAVQVKQQATTAFFDQRNKAVSGLSGLADALKQTAKSLADAVDGDGESQIPAGIAPLVKEAADRLSRSANFLREKDITGLLSEAQQLAKKQPALFMGGMFAVGLIGARLLKGASGNSSDSSGPSRGAASPYGIGMTQPASSEPSVGGTSAGGWAPVETLGDSTGASPSGTSIFDDLPAEPKTGSKTGGSISGGVTASGGIGSAS